jgi:flagellar operon protein
MTGPIHNGGLGVPPVPPSPATGAARRAGAAAGSGGVSFAEQLRRAGGSGGVEFSKHALQRLERRGIAADPATMRRLESGIERAAAKGARDAVVLIDDTAFVVSVRNRTVITAVDSAHMRDHVFTNIDSAAIA